MNSDTAIAERLQLLPARAATFLRRTPVPERPTLPAGVRTSLLDILLQCTASRGEAFVVHQLIAPALAEDGEINADTIDEILSVLDSFVVTEAACEVAFGPNWQAVVAHAVIVGEVLQEDRVAQLPTPIGVHRRLGAWLRAREAACETGRVDQWYRAQAAAWERSYLETRTLRTDETPFADIVATVRDVAAALCMRDLVGTHGFTQQHFDTLVAPWQHMTREADLAQQLQAV
ncbi:hypothetical protein [Aldersonia kunmingensis]|uniref:hypothetical protein n=1 Tax=Aldersonia kunmingensis TaxID=408066 RepID=UPI000831D325|nr:hypothetical protein [Aldersonia kunmingensis]